MPLYHKELGFPQNITLPKGPIRLVWSNHAKQEAASDKYGKIAISEQIVIDPYRIFEIEVNEMGELVKFLYRTRHDAKNDIVYAIFARENVVKTVWLNRRSDKHSTLQREKYAYAS